MPGWQFSKRYRSGDSNLLFPTAEDCFAYSSFCYIANRVFTRVFIYAPTLNKSNKARLFISIKQMPVFRQPFAAAGGIIFQKFHQRPEIRRMILMLQMRNLMRHDIADDKFRRQRQTPAVIDIIQRGTACPAGFRILYADVMHGFADFIRNGGRTGGKLFQRQLFNKVLDAAVQKFNPAGNIKNFVFFYPNGYCRARDCVQSYIPGRKG